LPEAGQKLSIRKLKSEIVEDSRRLPTAWPLIARAIDKALDDSRQANATLVVLYFPSKEEVYWDLIKQQMKSLEAFDDRVDQLRRSTLQFCRSRKVLCLDLTAALKRKAQMRERLYFSIDTHWNELGHEVVAAEIYRFLADQKLL
jgi:AcrR family transcriptional regulator